MTLGKSNRSKAIERHFAGDTDAQIARDFGVDEQQVREWVWGKVRKAPNRKSAPRSKPQPVSTCSKAQRDKVRDAACIVCRKPGPCEPAHVIDKSLVRDEDGDPRRVVPLCPGPAGCHRRYDAEDLDLLPYLEPHHRAELAYAVEVAGLLTALFRISGGRWVQLDREANAA